MVIDPIRSASSASSLRERWRKPDVKLSEPVFTPDNIGTGPTATLYADIVIGNPRPTVLRVQQVCFQARGHRRWWGRRAVEDLAKHERMRRLEQPEYVQPGQHMRVRLMHSGYESARDIRVAVVFRDRLTRRRWASKWTAEAFATEVAEQNLILKRLRS